MQDTKAPERLARLDVEQVPGALTLIGDPARGGYAWAGCFPNRWAAIADLLRRALAVEVREVSR